MQGKMKALVVHKPYEYGIEQVDIPALPAGWALVKTKMAAFCATDLEVLTGGIPVIYPRIPGHEWVGTVVEINDADQSLLGKRVVGSNDVCCLTCAACRSGEWRNCPTFGEIGFKHDGAYGEYFRVPLYALREVPECISDTQASLIEPLGVGLGTMDKVEARVGETMVIIGAGSIGLNVLAAARAAGVRRITVAERTGGRLEIARQMGAAHVFATSQCDLMAEVAKIYPQGPDIIVDATGAESCLQMALAMCKKSGRIGLAGYGKGKNMTIRVDDIHIKNLRVCGAGNNWNMVDRCLALLEDGITSTECLCSGIYKLDAFDTVVELAKTRPAGFVKAVFSYED